MKLMPEFCRLLVYSMLNVGNLIAEDDIQIVHSISGLEKLYESISDGQYYPYPSTSKERSWHQGDRVCSSILQSPFFSDCFEYQDPKNETVRESVRQNHHSSSMTSIENLYEAWLSSEYRYIPIKVVVLGFIHDDNALPCLAAERGTGNLKLFLISHPYNQAETLGIDDGRWFVGRFVFEYTNNPTENSVSLIAVAEPRSRLLKHLEQLKWNHDHYQEFKSKLSSAAEGTLKICDFADSQKVRLCSVGVSGTSNLRFLPDKESIDPKCQKKELNYNDHENRKFWFSVWVVGCKTWDAQSGDHTTFYISLGPEKYQLLIYFSKRENQLDLSYKLESYLLKY